MALTREVRLCLPGRLAYQGPISGGGTSEHSDRGRPDTVLRVDKKSREVRTLTYSVVFLRRLRIPPRFSPCKTASRETAKTSGFDPILEFKSCFDCKLFDVVNWVACLNGEDSPGGMPSHEALSVSPQGALEIPLVIGQPSSLVRDHFSSPRVVAKSRKCDVKYQIFTDTSNKGWGTHLEQDRKKATHKCPRVEGGISGPEKVQRPVPK